MGGSCDDQKVSRRRLEPYNRISLWVYPDVIGAPAISCSLVLHNDGSHKLPDPYNEGRHESVILKNHMWNHVVWEIAPLNRDRITALDFAYSLPKKFPDPGDQTILDIDQLEFGVVIPDGTLSERSEVTGSEIRPFLSDTTQVRSIP